MTSFKLKLFVYFLLVAVLPLVAVSWGFFQVQAQTEARVTDARLRAELRGALAAYREELQAASAPAVRLARSYPSASAGGRGTLARIAARLPHVSVAGTARPGRNVSGAVREITVVRGGETLGTLEVALPFDRRLVRRIEARAATAAGDRVAIFAGGRVVSSDPKIAGRLSTRTRTASRVRLHGRTYRALTERLPSGGTARLAVLTSEHAIDAARGAAIRRLLVGLAATLLFVALIAALEGRAIVRTIGALVAAANEIAHGRLDRRVRVRGRDELATLGRSFNTMADQLALRLEELESERARLREVLTGFGAALAATHDVHELVRVIVETAIEATGARGATFVGSEPEFVGRGDFDGRGERLELPLDGPETRFGILTLVATDLDSADVETASSLAAHAVVALENARLHKIVAEQAMTDGLTGLANRRQCDQALVAEIARVDRFGGSLGVVVADLDGFKSLNDTFGHAAGDCVLREFAEVLRGCLRASDLAGRWGGEEFLLLLHETDLDGAMLLAERARAALERRTILAPDGTPLRVTASFGVSELGPGADTAAALAAADAALYAAKRAGKNRVFADFARGSTRST